ncbi:aconitate hydratase [Geobacter sulfurreducens]|uniref:Aconitate hydratase, putative n=1 Tax=Geobacter sulfurreducens (strain ATCC 51573 / DSM 12127 / PCA) TaxID=243231 RepID=Q74AD1_GEOSL|nr:aconitate hydratase [Geobacter sulfurreducens]AAR35818.1 aconitate hydratase, putative [Geobacter sulfurreducens PCA]UAC03150.1 aconitate hydratase [Geobacter sulfurreducens]HCD97399.1 aconitate hydratase [Geobacter sulfurreducens]
MGKNLATKILEAHLVKGELTPGTEIALKIDHALLQDATGTMAMLEFIAMGVDRVKVELAAQYIDHNLLQTDNRNADDHVFLMTAAQRFGVHLSKPGNGVSHQVHLERFGVPGRTMLGADSHTTSAAGLSMIAIGAGGLDVSLAMAGHPFHLPCPKIWGVKLTGQLQPWVSAKDVILEMLRRHTVKGGVGKIIEYYGPGVATLSATDRAIIGNMGAELGATTSLFPSDHRTREFLEAQGRGEVWQELAADPDATYDEYEEIDLATVEPLIACPSSPDNVVRVADIEGLKVDQVLVGSSANSAFRDLMTVCRILDGRRVASHVSFNVNPGSRQVLENVADQGGIMMLLLAGAQIHQPGCLGCIGMGQAPGTDQVSLRTFPRNFPGRSGTKNDKVYLCSPETAAAAGIFGVVTDPRKLGDLMAWPNVRNPEKYVLDDSSIIFPLPPEEAKQVEIVTGPNIVPFPDFDPLPETLEAEVIFMVGDNISTDTIMPAGNKVLPYRSNVPAISQFVFEQLDPDFHKRAREKGTGVVIGGENYGQGSSREHAALAPRYLGIRAKIVKSFARIHKANLVNFGILPLTFKNPADYDLLKQGDRLEFPDVRRLVASGAVEIPVRVGGKEIVTLLDVSDRQRQELLAGGTLNYVKRSA